MILENVTHQKEVINQGEENMESRLEDSLQGGPNGALAPDVHTFVQFPPMFNKNWPVWPTEDGRSNNLSLLRSGYERH